MHFHASFDAIRSIALSIIEIGAMNHSRGW